MAVQLDSAAAVGGVATDRSIRRGAAVSTCAPARRPKRERRLSRPLSWRRGTVASLWADPCRVLLSPASGSSDCWTARSTGQLVRRPERASRAPLGVSSAAAPRSAQSASGMPTLIAEGTRRADHAATRSSTVATRSPNPRSAGSTSPFSSHATSSAGKSAPGRGRRHRLVLRAVHHVRERRRLFGGAGGVGE
jgi:hypothetical protein